jgi:hypothetical protein
VGKPAKESPDNKYTPIRKFIVEEQKEALKACKMDG